MMNEEDERLQCCSCGGLFTFTADQKRYYRERGFANKPKRCLRCRRLRNDGVLVDEILSERELLLELCKAVTELRLYIEKELQTLRQLVVRE